MTVKDTKTETLDEGYPSRKHFKQVADTIRNIENESKRRELANHHAEIFKSQNPRFDRGRFFAASNVVDKPNVPVDEETEIDEKWKDDYEAPASKRGMWNGKTEAQIRSALKSARRSGDTKREREAAFALRAKTGWGKVDEDIEELITSAIEVRPVDFVDRFNDILTAKIREKIEDKKEEIAQRMFKNPEDTTEEVEDVDETSKEKLGRYIGKATTDATNHAFAGGMEVGRNHKTTKNSDNHARKELKRRYGIYGAIYKLTNKAKVNATEETEE